MNSVPNEINSIVMFGSYARGDYNNYSDFDLCLFTKDESKLNVNELNIEKIVDKANNAHLNLIIYPQSILNQMLVYGSLFLWHLNFEGKVLYGNEFLQEQFKNLNSFDKHLEELDYHNKLFKDLIVNYNKIGFVSYFDYSLLFTITRNVCIILSHKYNIPKFGRFDCYSTVKKLFPDLPVSISEYEYLSNFKIIYDKYDSNYMLSLDNTFEENYFKQVDNLIDFAYAKIGN